MKRIFVLALCLAACADTAPTAVEEATQRQGNQVADSDFRQTEIVRDAQGIAQPRGASASTRAHNLAQIAPENFDREMEFATRGFIATLTDPALPKFEGRGSSIDLTTNDFIAGEAPDTVNPLLWAHSRIMAANEGLFELSQNIWQVRGFDVANITFIRSDNGYIVVDPLNAAEVARASYELLQSHVGAGAVTAVIYTHSHSDHFAGVEGVLEDSANVPIIAPRHFLSETASEWLTAGNAMGRRAFHQFGLFLPENERGRVGVGQGARIALGSHNLIAPTEEVEADYTTLTVDGVELQILNTPGAEAPSEFVIYVPRDKALLMSETVNASIHNVQTLRGALVRDAKAWADYLSESLWRFPDAEIMVLSHHWPRFGGDEVRDFIASQRDVYKYTHDQTVRLMNQGLTPTEIAENLRLPDKLANRWYNRGFYGTVSHNSKAVYGRYMGWYDGDPANLDPHIPTERAKRYVEAIGGAARVLDVAGEAFDTGDYRWSSELLKHLVFADPNNQPARDALADSYEQLGYQAESAIWRNLYLSGARELRQGGPDIYDGGSEDYLLSAATDAQLLDLMAVRLNPALAGDQSLSVNVHFKATDQTYNLRLRNGVLTHRPGPDAEAGTVSGDRRGLMAVGLGFLPLGRAKLLRLVEEDGDAKTFETLGAMMDKPSLDFNIIEP